jgi:hypothetical protein
MTNQVEMNKIEYATALHNQLHGGRVTGATYVPPAIGADVKRSIDGLACVMEEILCSTGEIIATIRYITESLKVMAGTTPPAENDDAIGDRVDKVIGDISAGRVSHRKVDDLADAAARSQRDRKLGTAIGRPDKQSVGVLTD